MLYGWDYYETMKSLFGTSTTPKTTDDVYRTHASEYASSYSTVQRLRFTTNHDETAWANTPMYYFNGSAGAVAASIITVGMGGVPLIYTGQEVGTANKTPFFTTSTINWAANPAMKKAYKELFGFRNQNIAMRQGSLAMTSSIDVVAFARTYNKQQVLVLVNVRNRAATHALNNTYQGAWTNTSAATETLGATVDLPPYGYKILKRML
jgi:glycosidase